MLPVKHITFRKCIGFPRKHTASEGSYDRANRQKSLPTGCVHDRNRRNGALRCPALWDIQVHRSQRPVATVTEKQSRIIRPGTENPGCKQTRTTYTGWPGHSKEILERRKNANPKLAPVVGQELAIRRKVCLTSNPNLYNDFLSELEKQAQSDTDDYVKNKRKLENTSVTLGGAGTGKTVAIGGIAADIISFDDDIEFVFAASNDEQATKLKSSVGHEGNVFITNDPTPEDKHKNIFKEYVNGTLPESYYDDVKQRVEFNPIVLNPTKTLFDPSKSRKVIIVDEATLLDVVK